MNEQKMKELGMLLQLMTGANQAFGPDYQGQELALKQKGQEMDSRYRDWIMSPENPDAQRARMDMEKTQQEMQRMELMTPLMLEQERLQNLGLQQQAFMGFNTDTFLPDTSLASPIEAARQKAAWAQKFFELSKLPFNPQQDFNTNFNNLPR
jgi:hypothetical protein